MAFFVWLCMYGALPMNALHHSRGLASSPICSRCDSGIENVLYCIRDCPHSLDLWSRLGFTGELYFFIDDVISWLEKHLKC